MTRAPRDALGLAGMALAAVGTLIAGYLTYVHFAGIDPVCTGGGGCATVQASEWSELAGLPVALLGLLGYLGILGALLAWPGESGRLAVLVAAWGGLAFSAYLQYRALVTVEATCVWCIASALTMGLLTLAATARYLVAPAVTIET